MSLSRNVTAGLTASAWSAIVSVAVVPFYLAHLGIEAYGLIGFFAALQALFSILDMGMAPTISREVARSGTPGEREGSRALLHAMATVYWAVAGVIAGAALTSGHHVAAHWLRESALSQQEVGRAVMLMGVVVACRWPNGIYSGALVGAQRLVLVSGVGAFFTTASAIGAVLVLALVSATIEAFFVWQAVVGVVQAFTTRWLAWRAMGGGSRSGFDLAALRRVWRFSAGIGVSGVLGMLLLQSDKIILSRLVTLEELGRYTLAGLASRLLYVVLTPVFSAVYPRMTALVAAGDTAALTKLYRGGTRLLMTVICPIAAYIALFAADAARLWTSDPALIASVPATMALLTIGTALNGVMHFPYALQLAHGNARLPLITTASLLVLFVPALAALTLMLGIVGAGAAWLALNFLYVIFGSWLTHRKFLTGIGWVWIGRDVLAPALVAAVISGTGWLAIDAAVQDPLSRLVLGGLLPLAAIAAIAAMSPSLMHELRLRLGGRAATA